MLCSCEMCSELLIQIFERVFSIKEQPHNITHVCGSCTKLPAVIQNIILLV